MVPLIDCSSLEADFCKPFWVITSYFNPEQYRSRYANYICFTRSLHEKSIPCLTVECAFGEQPFQLPASPSIRRTRTTSVLWQKERLLNSTLKDLPPWVQKVAWIDADVLFENAEWYNEASCLLDQSSVVQLFERIIRLPQGRISYDGKGESWTSFCAKRLRDPGCERHGWDRHGHTGFAWAAQRGVLDACGLFDLALPGCGDHLMAHAFVSDLDSRCIETMVGIGTPLHRAFVRWGKAYQQRGCRIGNVSGTILHLWHGETKNRNYNLRCQELKALRFDPRTDIKLSAEGCWEWTGNNPSLERWANDVFAWRKEDGDVD